MDYLRTRVHTILRKSERYFKTDMIYLAKSSFWLLANYGVISVSSIILSILFAHLVPKETYGVYRYILSISLIIGALSLTGMNTSVTQAVAQGFKKTLSTSFWVQLKWGVLPLVVSLIVGIYYILQENIILGVAIIILGIFIPLSNSANTYTAFMNGEKNFRGLFISGISTNTFYTVVMITTLLFTHNILYMVLAYVASTTLGNLYFYIRTSKSIPLDAKDDPVAISYGRHLSYMNVIGTIAAQVDSILVFHYFGAVQLAIYSFATLVPEKIRGLFKFFAVIALPKFSEKTTTNKESLYLSSAHKTKILMVFALCLSIFYIISAGFIYHLLFPSYEGSVIYSQIYSLSFIGAISIVPLTFLTAIRSQKFLYIYNIASPVVQIILLGIMIYYYGLWGAIIAKIISGILNLIFLIPASKKYH